jgi:hypothetical protein
LVRNSGTSRLGFSPQVMLGSTRLRKLSLTYRGSGCNVQRLQALGVTLSMAAIGEPRKNDFFGSPIRKVVLEFSPHRAVNRKCRPMQNIVIDKTYVFVPPHRGRWWAWLLQRMVRRRLRRTYGVEAVECHGTEKIRASLAAGHGIKSQMPNVAEFVRIRAENHAYPPNSYEFGYVRARISTFDI